jgi:hypothetical protein
MTTDITRTDYPIDPTEGTPLEIPPNSWLPTTIDVYPWLGYSFRYKNRHTGSGDTRVEASDARIVQVHRLVAWLQYWELQLRDMTSTAMANQVGQLTLDFGRGSAMVKIEASRTLHELATLIDTPILKDKYYPKQRRQPFQAVSLI